MFYKHASPNFLYNFLLSRYCIPAQEESKFQAAMKEIVPTLVSSQARWLKEDTAMVVVAFIRVPQNSGAL